MYNNSLKFGTGKFSISINKDWITFNVNFNDHIFVKFNFQVRDHRLVLFIVKAVSSKTKLLLSRTAEHHMKVKH
jgi:hypothetical protein